MAIIPWGRILPWTVMAIVLIASPQASADAKDDAFSDCFLSCAGPNSGDLKSLACVAACTATWAAAKGGCWIPDLSDYFPEFDTSDGTLSYKTTDTAVLLSVGRFDGVTFLTGTGTVTSVDFLAVTVESHDAAITGSPGQFHSIPWSSLGSGTFNATTDRWELSVPGSSLPNINGYVLRATFHDPAIPAPLPAFVTPGDVAGAIDAVAFAAQPPVAIPALSGRGVIALGVLLAAAMYLRIRRSDTLCPHREQPLA